MKMSGKITGFCLLGVAAVGLSLVGCSEDSRSWWSPFPREVEATLPSLAVAEAVVVEPMGSRAACANDGVSEGADGLFTVSLGPEGGADAPRSRFVATRADMSLSNVWVLQFDASGATKACSYVGTVAAGQRVKAALQSGEGYTVWIVANGPASDGLTTSNPATLSDFETKMLYTVTPASDELIPLSGKLTNVRVLDNGQVLVGSDNTVVPEVTLTRAMAKVDLLLEYNVSGAELDGVWLYQVPAGACYGLGGAVTDYPASGTVSNFAYRIGNAPGLAPTSPGSGTVTHTWYVGDNRRGQNPVIRWEKNKGENNAPAMATYARIKSHESSDTAKGLFHDVYLGENVTTDFNVLRNRHYIYRVRIGGTLDDQKLLAERDDRVWAGTLEYLDGTPTVDPDLSLPIPVDGQTMRVTFNGYWTGSGIQVRATVVGGEELATGTAACQAGNTGSATLEIPKNEGGAERQIEFAYEWKGEWNVIGIGTQAGYGVTGAKVTPEGDIPGQGGDYVVTVNGAWEEFVKVRVWDGSTSLTNITVLTPGADVNFTVPANKTGADRTVTFQYQWGDEWITIGQPRTQAFVPISISSATVTPAGDIPGEGKTFSLTLTGVLPDEGVDVRAQSGGTALATGKATASGAIVSLTVPANASYSSRSVTFEYNWNGTWMKIGDSRTQAGYSVSNATHNAPATIPGQGGSYNVTLTGHLPSGVSIRALSGSSVLVGGTVTRSGSAVSLSVPGNQSYNNRTVTFQYNWNGTWTKIGADRTQQGYNVTKASVSPAGDIPGTGGTYTVKLEGWGGYKIRAISGSTELVVKNDYKDVANYSASIAIPANPSTTATRSVTFQYSTEGEWTNIETRNQEQRTTGAANLTYYECETRCRGMGGVPSLAQLQGMDFDGWPTYLKELGVVAYWSNELAVYPDGSYVNSAACWQPWTGTTINPPADKRSELFRCRCLNE